MTEQKIANAIIDYIKKSRYNIKYFTVNRSSQPTREVISFHESEDDGIGGVLPDMLIIDPLDADALSAFMQRKHPVRTKGDSYTYPTETLAL